MIALAKTWLKRAAIAVALILLTILAVRAFEAWRSPPLSLWHREVPRELDADAIDAADWAAWLAAETRAFDDVRTHVTDQLPADERVAANRFFAGSPMNTSQRAFDWNRTYVLMPEGPPRGAVVLLHGLTDSPYSLRHIASHYRSRGFVAVGMRMPGHGTVPAGLTRARWEDWMAATRLAVRHARALAGENVPLHLVGYSNGGALALEYSLESLDDGRLAKPDQLVLISPMVGITSFARFAGVLGWPAVFPGFAKAAWLDTLPEYNPFKYNSFPVNAARQSSQLVDAVQDKLLERVRNSELTHFPRVLAFQSTLDSTVFTSALVDNLFAMLPENGSELVLFGRNRSADAGPLLRADADEVLGNIMQPVSNGFSITVVSNTVDGVSYAETLPAGEAMSVRSPITQTYPRDMYSLSHVALPFPVTDGLYGSQPDPREDFGVRLGTVAVRGERGALVVGAETLMRASCNPFFDYLLERIDGALKGSDLLED
ncbi:MAG: alpha/beta hydrolase [Steroidobacteraceae bacterium]|nr:alpha/beta hydrolase [Steroidobacteraceae bacterium]